MADNIPSGLGVVGTYGVTDPDLQALRDAQQASITALEERYKNPNWFNVAAGFFKPQLGGFTASLGSASQAMGENLEKQRESQIPLAKMRAELAMTGIGMGKDKAASEAFSKWKATHKPMDEATYSQIVGLAPNSSVAAAAKAAYEGERAGQGVLVQQQTLRQAQGSQALNLLQQQFSSGAITKGEYQRQLADIKAAYSPTQPVTSARPIGAPGTTPTVEGAPAMGAPAMGAPAMGAPAMGAPPSSGLAPDVAPTGSYANEGDLKGIAGNVPFDAAKEIATIKASLPTLNATDRATALKNIAELEGGGINRAPVAPAKKEIITPVFGKESGLTPEQLATSVKPQEELAQRRYAGLQEVAADENYRPLERAVSSQIDLINKNKDASSRIHAVLSRGGPANAFLAALNEGVGISINGLTGQVRLPVETFIKANFKPEDQDLAMTMANNYAAIALAKQKMGSVNPNSARNSELGLYAGLTPSLHTTPNASLRALLHFKQDLDFTKALHDDATGLLFNRHPTQALAQDDPARFSSALNNPGYSKLYEPFAAKHSKIDEAFQKSLKAKP